MHTFMLCFNLFGYGNLSTRVIYLKLSFGYAPPVVGPSYTSTSAYEFKVSQSSPFPLLRRMNPS